MAHTHEYVTNTKRIWTVFVLLSLITIVEVALGIVKPESLHDSYLLGLNLLNWIFIILTVVKAYYIVWAFMHMEGEKNSLKFAVVGTLSFMIIYIMFVFLVEGDYIFGVFKNGTIKWNF